MYWSVRFGVAVNIITIVIHRHRYFNLLNTLTSTEDEDDVTNANDIVMLLLI